MSHFYFEGGEEEIVKAVDNNEAFENLNDDFFNEENMVKLPEIDRDWLQSVSDGFAIRDLEKACEQIQSILILFEAEADNASENLVFFLKICEKPIFEVKSNEKLTSTGKYLIENFYCRLLDILPVVSGSLKIKIIRTLRMIVNCGIDPSRLRSSDPVYRNEEYKIRLKDRDYILERLSSCGGLPTLVTQCQMAVECLDYHSSKSTNNNSSNNNEPAMSYEEELAMYGLPIVLPPKTRQPSQKSLQSFSSMSGFSIGSPARPLHQESKAVLRDLTQILLDFSLDISEYPACAIAIGEAGICDAIIKLVEKDLDHDPHDKRIPQELELLWYILDHFTTQIQSLKLKEKEMEAGHAVSNKEIPVVASSSSITSTMDEREKNLAYYINFLIDLENIIRILTKILVYYLLNGFRQFEKECRNEVVILLSLLVEFPDAIGHFIRSEVFNLLITYACIEEEGRGSWAFFTPQIANSRNFGTNSDIDLEFKKLIWMLINALLRSNDPDALLCFAASPLMSCLLKYLEQELPDAGVHSATAKRTTTNNTQLNTPSIVGGGSLLMDNHPTMQSHSTFEENTSVHQQENTSQLSTLKWRSTNKPTHLIHATSKGKPLLSTALLTNTTFNKTNNTGGGGGGASATLSQTSTLRPKKGIIESLTLTKLKEFQVQASIMLMQSATKVLTEFERLQGPARILNLTVKYAYMDDNDMKDIVYYMLILLYRCLVDSVTIRSFFEESQSIRSFLYLSVNCIDDNAKAQAVRTIAAMSANYNQLCQSQILHLQGLESLLIPIRQYVVKRPPVCGLKAGIKVSPLTEVAAPYQDPTENPFGGEISELIVSILDCLKHSVVGNISNELHFADLEGLDVLLDLLETAPYILRLQVLRLLSDLLENSKLVHFANVWRSPKTLRSAAQVLCHAYMDEEARLDAERKEQGVICDVFHALSNQQWPLSVFEHHLAMLGKADQINTQSLTVSKLATAIQASRNANQTNLPSDICVKALDTDLRLFISSILGNMGMFDIYAIQDASNPFKLPSGGATASSSMCSIPTVDNIQDDGEGSGDNNPIITPSSSAPALLQQQKNVDNNPQQQLHNINTTMSRNTNTTSRQNSPTRRQGATTIAATQRAFNDVLLSPKERQVLVLAKKYSSIRQGEWWNAVRQTIQEHKLRAIEADTFLMDCRLEEAFDASIAAAVEQMLLCDEDTHIKRENEDEYLGQILTKKHQQVKAEWLKKNAKSVPKRPVVKKIQTTI